MGMHMTVENLTFDILNVERLLFSNFKLAIPEYSLPSQPATNWLDTLSEANRESVFILMRSMGDKQYAHETKGANLQPRYGECAVGGQHFDEFCISESLRSYLMYLRKGFTPRFAFFLSSIDRKDMINKWNSTREYQVQRADIFGESYVMYWHRQFIVFQVIDDSTEIDEIAKRLWETSKEKLEAITLHKRQTSIAENHLEQIKVWLKQWASCAVKNVGKHTLLRIGDGICIAFHADAHAIHVSTGSRRFKLGAIELAIITEQKARARYASFKKQICFFTCTVKAHKESLDDDA